MRKLVSDAWLIAHDGDRDAAFRKMRRAEEMATTPAWRVWALGGRALMAAAFGELGSAREHAALGVELADGIAWSAVTSEERAGLLVLAVANPISANARLQAMEDYVCGLVLDAAGQDAVRSFLARRAGTGASADPIARSLTPAQRAVLALLLDGLSAREIAARTGRAYNTVRVHIDRLREAFKASSVHALVVECHRRGIR